MHKNRILVLEFCLLECNAIYGQYGRIAASAFQAAVPLKQVHFCHIPDNRKLHKDCFKNPKYPMISGAPRFGHFYTKFLQKYIDQFEIWLMYVLCTIDTYMITQEYKCSHFKVVHPVYFLNIKVHRLLQPQNVQS